MIQMNKTINDKKNRIISVIMYMIIIFPLLGENLISTILGDTSSKICSIISCVIILMIVIKERKLHIDNFLIIMLLLIIEHIIINFIFAPKNLKITTANNMITPYGLIGYFMIFLLINTYIKNADKMKIIFKSMMIVMTISVISNLVFTADLHIANNIQTFKEAVNTGYTNSRRWLFGHRNMIFIHHLMWILISYIYYKLNKRSYSKLYFWQMLFTILVGVISWNSTMMLTTIVILILGMFRKRRILRFSMGSYVFLYLILEIGIVFLRVQNYFSFIIEDVLNRNLSFTGRTYVWNYYINQFANEGIFNKIIGNFGITELTINTHNMFLGLLAFTGIIGLVLYFTLLYASAKELKKQKNTDTSKFISIIIFGFLLNSLTMEFYLQPLLAMYIGYKIKEINLLVESDEGA